MSFPALDLAPIVSALEAALVPAVVAEVVELSNPDRANPRRAARRIPSLGVMTGSVSTSPVGGLSGRRQVTHTLLITIQTWDAAGRDEVAGAGLRAIRNALWEQMAGLTTIGWSAIQYQSGGWFQVDESLFVWLERYTLSATC